MLGPNTSHTHLGHDRKGDVLDELWFQSKSSEIACSSVGIVNEVNQSHYRPEVPRGFQEVKVPRLRDNGPGWW